MFGFLQDKKKSKFFYLFKDIKDLEIKYFTEIEKARSFNALVVSAKTFIKNYDFFNRLFITNNIKCFVLISKKIKTKTHNKLLYDPMVIKTISKDIPLKRISELLREYKEYFTCDSERRDLLNKNKIQTEKFNTLTKIGISLSVERDIEILFDLILTKAREITNSDAGSIYLTIEAEVKDDDGALKKDKMLKFVHSQNFSFPIQSPTFTIPLTKNSIVGYSALTGKVVNIKDAHKISGEADYSYNVEAEKKMKVHNRSIIVVPMKNHRGDIIGVIQLFNKKKNFQANIFDPDVFESEVQSYELSDEEIVGSLASQAAVSLENSMLYKEIKSIFEGFIRASVTAIESRDPTTSGHSERVAKLTIGLAKKVNEIESGVYKDVKFSSDDLKNIEYAGLLHDFGKISVREEVLVKAEKLYPRDMDKIKARLNYIKKLVINDNLLNKIRILKEGGIERYNSLEAELDNEVKNKIDEIDYYLSIIVKANKPTVLEEDNSKIISGLVDKWYESSDGLEKVRYLEEEEMKSLTVKRGSLTESERKEIESHVIHSYNFLRNIPWTKDMSVIPEIAYKHHEKLDGKGYPQGVKSEDISIQARMMAIADIYDALTAADRPYKKAVSEERALDILNMEKDDGKIDAELLKIFIDSKVYKEF
ncbi:MAG TPA: HD domain-containing phosphohydrolase [Spirochaetota bacterium]|nr:HD domain-containing phosphohydrolase [Spirochaetota bacterium]